jgi:hypothetical protein
MTQLVSLYELLPAIYRIRDAERGAPLGALLAVIESELRTIEADIVGLYDNMFIETCDEWVVPYIGDLLRVRGLYAAKPDGFSQRAYVANTLTYRRRKGTAAVLEQLARDTTGWPTRVVEFFQRLRTTQHMHHIRPHNRATIDLRDAKALELIGGPFEQAQHAVDVRRIRAGRGHYNIPNIGLFVWSLQSYLVERATPRAAVEPPAGRFRFSPIGVDAPLFNRPQREPEITHLAEERYTPQPLRRRVLYDDLEAYRAALAVDTASAHSTYFGDSPVLAVFFDGEQLPPEEIVICHLGDWDELGWTAPASRRITRSDEPDEATQDTRVAVDPQLGRLAPLSGIAAPARIEISYTYGFSGDIGSGPYNRKTAVVAVLAELQRPITWQAAVGQSLEAVGAEPIFTTLEAAVAAWNAQPDGTVGLIAMSDSAMYEANLTAAQAIRIPPTSVLLIVAAEWPIVPTPSIPEQKQRVVGQFCARNLRPHIRGDIFVSGTGTTDPGVLGLIGLLIDGNVHCLAGNLGGLWVDHCTIVPGTGGLQVIAPNDSLDMRIKASICGPLNLAASIPRLHVCDTIVSSGADSPAEQPAITAAGTAVNLHQTTVFGTVTVRSLEAENVIFTGLVGVARTQIGCVRCSFVPHGSRTPRRYRCQPDLALEDLSVEEQRLILASLRPTFTSLEYDQPGYAQLGLTCPAQIRTGAEDGSEMGVFSHLQQPQRLANLRVALEEYLRFGLEAGIIFVT